MPSSTSTSRCIPNNGNAVRLQVPHELEVAVELCALTHRSRATKFEALPRRFRPVSP
jgi:hypothetical protein